MDNLSPGDRKKNMSRIRSKGNSSTERRLRCALVGAAISGFRMHMKSLPGRPDFAFPLHKVAVFVDGCFWHGCPECYVRPKSNQQYWDKKLIGNRARDTRVNSELIDMGWAVVRIWEHSMKKPKEARNIVVSALQQTRNSNDG